MYNLCMQTFPSFTFVCFLVHKRVEPEVDPAGKMPTLQTLSAHLSSKNGNLPLQRYDSAVPPLAETELFLSAACSHEVVIIVKCEGSSLLYAPHPLQIQCAHYLDHELREGSGSLINEQNDTGYKSQWSSIKHTTVTRRWRHKVHVVKCTELLCNSLDVD